ncbi:hypothetical protein PF008_g24389 [Phytophthora fragariae]|uniref:Uncharacterized protein n=1 Tax=Phytophthora fragariae TaxID=53985 RepID=A0A6G0QNP0_9STRA|nr:hypothetical protein PF008_g24389 [Phytophthora fragariae]
MNAFAVLAACVCCLALEHAGKLPEAAPVFLLAAIASPIWPRENLSTYRVHFWSGWGDALLTDGVTPS